MFGELIFAASPDFNQVRSPAVSYGSTKCTRNDNYDKEKMDSDQLISTRINTIVVKHLRIVVYVLFDVLFFVMFVHYLDPPDQ